MANDPNSQQATRQPSLRLTGSGRVSALAPARPAPVPVSVLEVEDPSRRAQARGLTAPGTPGTSGITEQSEPEIIPFQVRAAMVAGGNQPAIRSKLVAGRMPGVVLFRVP